MPYDYDSLVTVPGGTLTTFRTELTAAAALTSAPISTAFTALADVALPVNNRYLTAARVVYLFADWVKLTALRDAARAVLDQATGIA